MAPGDMIRLPLAVLVGLLVLGVFLGLCVLPFWIWRRRVMQRGYPGLLVYLRELPRTDEEKLDALELALKGAGLCILGILFPPFIVIGLVPLYYGCRKLGALRLGVFADSCDKPSGPIDDI
jgi:hypothetical protein